MGGNESTWNEMCKKGKNIAKIESFYFVFKKLLLPLNMFIMNVVKFKICTFKPEI